MINAGGDLTITNGMGKTPADLAEEVGNDSLAAELRPPDGTSPPKLVIRKDFARKDLTLALFHVEGTEYTAEERDRFALQMRECFFSVNEPGCETGWKTISWDDSLQALSSHVFFRAIERR